MYNNPSKDKVNTHIAASINRKLNPGRSSNIRLAVYGLSESNHNSDIRIDRMESLLKIRTLLILVSRGYYIKVGKNIENISGVEVLCV